MCIQFEPKEKEIREVYKDYFSKSKIRESRSFHYEGGFEAVSFLNGF